MAGKFSKHIFNQNEDAQIDMTPMLDVVFIMLIFFIVSTSFIKETGIDVNRPVASSTQVIDQNIILVAIDENSLVWIDKQQVPIGNLKSKVERAVLETKGASVVIQGDTQARLGLFIQVMDQIKLAGVENISIASVKPK
ncbi:ExbD/TolR family protein [Marinicellulosiphila megalodicopiae]|uniref:ExbD/TolR family protein n=1 Tax=Marinicellulosiphila megalodicopiae TaxID=2724896 RepID=UPI003BAED6A8